MKRSTKFFAILIVIMSLTAVSTVISQTITLPVAPRKSTDLSVNGGFEAKDASDKPDLTPWVLTNSTKDKIRCGKAGISHSGECGFKFKGGVGERAALQQEPDLNGLVLQQDGHVIFSGYINWSEATAFKMVLSLYDIDQPQKIKVTVPQSFTYGEYLPFSYDFTLAIPTDYVSFTFKHKGKAGKTLLDDVSIVYVLPEN